MLTIISNALPPHPLAHPAESVTDHLFISSTGGIAVRS